MNKEEIKVEVIEIWKPVKKGGEIIQGKKNLKLVVFLVNGLPIQLEKDWVMERRFITDEEAENIKSKKLLH